MSFGPELFQRALYAYAASVTGALLFAAIIGFGFRSTSSAMLAEAALQESRLLPAISAVASLSQKAQFTTGDLSRTRPVISWKAANAGELIMRLSGGCSCGAVRFSIRRYLYAQLCHCDACKRRTGSAYGISVAIENDDLREFRGEVQTFTRTAESGNAVEYDFCPICATTVRWRVAALRNRLVLAGGASDDPRAFTIVGEMYTADALPWARIGCEVTRPGAPDDSYRSAMIARTAEAGAESCPATSNS